ncbi:AAA domain-containing protein [Micromonospora sp. WMMD718]|uniref:AAA domain-containing protein n=1 Tax=unclassified Micromonospora TaxID=2617518 RepID=UPI00064BBCCE|nr:MULTISPECIES: AAA domain-containing protein [unclassified Micromonospora]MDG4752633.1 AAA domain-containing protein [Micromonospora sp. WMMD718]
MRLPRSWVDEYCEAAEPELFAASEAERTEVCLSYPQRAGWLADHALDEIRADLAEGLLVEERTGRDGSYYVLTGTRFQVFAQSRSARDSGVPQAYVTSVRPARGLGRTETVRPRQVRLRPVWEEEYGNLPELLETFAEGLRIVQRRRALRDSASRELHRRAPAPRPRGDLHARVRRRYQPLLHMIELLEQRSTHEGAVRGTGIVAGEGRLANQPVLWLRLDRQVAFNEGRTVAVSGPEVTAELRLLSADLDGDDPVLALAAPPTPIAPWTQVRLEQQGRFALGRHSKALGRFLDEQVEGDWEHLALLLTAPARLPAVTFPPLPTYFDDRLNREQRAAVDGAVRTPHVYHVQGPPGTGKTTVITEVVRQLVARGERVLLVAPMHVAVDEVLRRLADQPGVLALRISWDESRVARELRRYLPKEVSRTYLRQARRPATSQARRWRAEADRLREEGDAADAFLAADARWRSAAERLRSAERERGAWRDRLAADLSASRAGEAEAIRALDWLATALPPVAQRTEMLRAQLAAVPLSRRLWSRIRAAFDSPDEVARLDQTYRASEAERRRLDDNKRSWTERRAAARTWTAELEAWHVSGERDHGAEVRRRRAEAQAARADAEHAADRVRTLTEHDPTGRPEAEVRRWRDRLAAELTRRERRIHLERRWFELSGLAEGTPESLVDQVDADLRRSANLICCTTTGVNRDLGDADFDTLIVDEASRVVDSEFLIGAVRARRWVLVGDEHQLPPYVEPADEHHLHALAALHLAERGAAADLRAAVEHLAAIWTEDEELHQFRAEAVLAAAERLRDSGSWRERYRRSFEAAWRRLGEGGADAERTLLTAMRGHLVRSLFEVSVAGVPPALRQRLRVQRRMIEPIAALVSAPVYGGDYLTPDRPDVTPLRYGGTNTPVVLVDTSVYGGRAKERTVGSGFVNELEADLVVRMCRSWEERLRRSGGERVTVSVLTFYRRQATEIRGRLGGPAFDDFRSLDFQVVDAIDKIQGQESDLVFLSFCRASVGRGTPSVRYGRWLQDIRRLNVACTRARRGLVLVGHVPTLRRLNGVPAAEEFYRNLFGLLDERPEMEIAKGLG